MNNVIVFDLVVGVVLVVVLNYVLTRTRTGNFRPLILGVLCSQESEQALLFHELYTRSLSCEDIGAVCEQIYGHHYSKQQVNFLSRTSKDEIYKWLSRQLSPRYLAVYIDATFSPTHRDGSVSQEAYYTMLGLLPDGNREVLCVVNHPTEGALNWELELNTLKERGVEQIHLIISDALQGIERAVFSAFPQAAHQLCVAKTVSLWGMSREIERVRQPYTLLGTVINFHFLCPNHRSEDFEGIWIN